MTKDWIEKAIANLEIVRASRHVYEDRDDGCIAPSLDILTKAEAFLLRVKELAPTSIGVPPGICVSVWGHIVLEFRYKEYSLSVRVMSENILGCGGLFGKEATFKSKDEDEILGYVLVTMCG